MLEGILEVLEGVNSEVREEIGDPEPREVSVSSARPSTHIRAFVWNHANEPTCFGVVIVVHELFLTEPYARYK